MQKSYFAHSENEVQQRHLLKDHLASVAKLTQDYLHGWSAAKEGYLAGMLHDLGKYGDLFQRRLDGKESGLDHWSQGTKLASLHYHSLAAAWAIQGHHVGLQPLCKVTECNKLEKLAEDHPLNLRLSEENLALLEQRLSDDGLHPTKPQTPFFKKLPQGRVDQMLDIRRLFSALVDADFIDTESHFQGNQNGKQRRKPGQPLQAEKALKLLHQELEHCSANSSSPPEVLAVREALQTSCFQQAQQKTGLFTLTAPTGSGKTLAMLGFALQHALENQLERIIMVIPYLTIIEQTASIYRRIFEKEFGEEYVLEHHSMANLGKEEEEQDSEGQKAEERLLRRKRLLAENWDAPLVVTTSVQCLQSLFSNRSSSCRKIHRMANAVILLDEVQTLPNDLAIPTLGAFSHIAAEWNSSVVFSTATQPAFQHLHEQVLKQSFQGWSPREIAHLPEAKLRPLKRVEYHWQLKHPLSWQELAQEMVQSSQSLAIVNLKKHAKALFEHLAEMQKTDVLHISTNLCPSHRTEVLEQVKKKLDSPRPSPCFLVATQCVEAGVDLDFPNVWRALAPLDAIIQAAGRCNREGKLADLGKVCVFLPEEARYPGTAYKQAALLTQVHANRAGETFDLYDMQKVQAYYQELYDLSDIKSQNQALQESIKTCDFPEVAHHYRLIKDSTINIVVPWKKEKALFETLKAEAEAGNLNRQWFHRARLLSVSLYRPNDQSFFWDSLIPIEGKYREVNDWFFLVNEELYHEHLGLLPPELNLWIA